MRTDPLGLLVYVVVALVVLIVILKLLAYV